MWRSESNTDKSTLNAGLKHKKAQDMETVTRELSKNNDLDDNLDKAWREWEKTFDATKDSIMLINGQFKIIQANLSTIEFFGKSYEQIVGNQCYKLVHGTDRPPKECPLKKSMYSKKHEQSELYLPEKDMWVELSADPILDKQGNIENIVHIIRDITKYKRAEQSILKEKDRAQKYLDVAGVMMVAIDSEYRVGMINKKGCEILGYKEEEIIGKNWLNNFIPERKREEIKVTLDNLWKQKSETQEISENPILTKDNQERLIAWHNTILKDDTGQVYATLSSGEDITDRKKTEIALKESEEHYRMLAESMSDGLTHVDENGIKLYINKKAADIFGCKPEQMIGRHWSEFYDPQARKIVEKEIRLRKKGTIRPYELQNTTKDGRSIYLRISPQPIYDKDGQYKGSITIITDITDRKKAEEALRRQHNLLRLLIDNIPDEIYVKDTDSRMLLCNRTVAEHQGFSSPSEMIGKTDFDFYPAKQAEKYRAEEQQIISSGEPKANYLERCTSKRGREIWGLNSKIPLHDNNDKIIGIVGIGRNVTDLKRAEEMLRESENKFRELASSITDVFFAMDGDLRYTYWNKASEELTGIKAEDAIGKTIFEIFPDTEDSRKVVSVFRDVLNQKQPKSFEIEYTNRDKHCFFEVNAYPNEDGISVFAKDITERKLAEEQLQTSRAQLSNAMKIAKLGYWEYDVDDDLFTFNDHFYDIYRTTAELVGGYKMTPACYADTFLPPEDRLIVNEEMKKALETTDPNFSRQLEHRIIFPDGEIGYVSVRYFVVKDKHGRTIKTYGANQDITERRLSEEALRQSEEKFYKAFHATSNLMGISTIKQGRIIDINDAYARLTGYTRDEIIGRTALQLNLWVDPKQREEIIRKLQEEGKVYDFEVRIRTKSGSIITVLFSADIIILNNQPCMINMAIDITERKKAESALRKSEEHYRTLAETMNDGLGQIDENGNFIYVNNKYSTMLGYRPDEMIGEKWTEFYDKNAQKIIKKQLVKRKKGIAKPYEVTTTTKNRRKIHLRISPQVIFDKNETYRGASSIITDITDRKEAERIIRESQKRLVEAQHIAKMGDFTWDVETGDISWSDALFDLLHYDRSEKIDYAKVNNDIHHPEDLDRITQWLNDCILSDTTELTPKEYRLIRRDGEIIYVRTVGIIERRKGKQPKIFATVQDITEQKQTEQAIKANEIRFRELFNNMNSGVAIYSPCDNGEDFIFSDFNKASERIENIKKADLIGRKVTEIFPGVKEFGLFDVFQRVWKTGEPQFHPVSLYKDDRLIGWRENYVYKLPSGEIIAVYEDLTDHVKARQALEQERYKLREYFENLPALAYNITFDGKIADCNQVTLNTLGYKNKNELIGKPLLTTIYPPSSHQRAQELFEKWKKEGKLRNEEIQIVTKHGEIIDVLLNVTTIFDHNGTPVHSLSTHTVITDRKKAEEALREREALLNEVGTIAKIGGWEMDLVTRKAKWTKGTYDIVEIEYDGAIPGPDEHVQYYLPEYRPIVEEAMRGLIEENKPLDFEAQLLTVKGNIKWCRAIGRAIRKEGKCIKVYGTFQDVTERKRIENIARDREVKLMSIVRAAPIAIGLISNRVLLQVNNKMCEMLGYSTEELIGQNSRIVYPDDQEYEYVGREKYHQINEYGTGTVETKWKHKDGQIIDIILSSTPLDPADLSKGLTFTALDNTQRKKAEHKLLKEQSRLKALASELTLTEERERRRLATELHDEIGQLLAVSKMKLDSALRIDPNEKSKNILNDICSMLDTAITQTRTLTFDLSSPVLYNLGFEAAVSEWLSDQIENKYGIRTEFEDDGQPKPMDDDISTLLFRNVRELLLNIVKHADAKNINVSVKRTDEQICVTVEDDGIGLEPEEMLQILDQTSGFGLFSIRQRLEELGGKLEIESQTDKGTKVRMTAPLTK